MSDVVPGRGVAMTACPDEIQLELLLSAAGESESREIHAHVAGCERCRSWIEDARADEALLGSIRQAYGRMRESSRGGSSAVTLEARDRDVPRTFDPASIRIPGLRIGSMIGEGGMGIVFEAEQEHPRRPVAVKIVRGGLFADPFRNRLIEREAAALGRLRHPNIAAIYGAGRTDDGLNYVIMERVHGERLTDFARSLSARRRLELFETIARAIHYAHQHGVEHRDLKPANILVEREPAAGADARPVPKVLDFGLARVIDPAEQGISAFADLGKIRGTLAYMSPEQAAGRATDLDYRTDIYSLGAVLYELLCGRLPLELRELSVAEAVRRVQESAPAPPSAHDRRWRGDLDTIVLRAIEKDPARRYASAGDLAADIRRYLEHQPILARPPTLVYQARRFVRRHVAGCAFAATLALLLSGFAVISRVQAIRVARERDLAVQVSRFLQGMLADIDPAKTGGPQTSLRSVLDGAATRVDRELANQPATAATMRITIGQSYAAIGAYDKAEAQFRQALAARRGLLGEEHELVAEAMHELGLILKKSGQLREAESLYTQALDLRRRLLPADDPAIAESLNNLGALRVEQNRWSEAEPFLREAIDLRRRRFGDRDEQLAIGLGNLATILSFQGRRSEGAAMVREAIHIRQQVYGDADPESLTMLANWSNIMLHMGGDPDMAESFLRELLERRRRLQGPAHPSVLEAMESLAVLMQKRGNAPGAAALRRDAAALHAAASQPSAGP